MPLPARVPLTWVAVAMRWPSTAGQRETFTSIRASYRRATPTTLKTQSTPISMPPRTQSRPPTLIGPPSPTSIRISTSRHSRPHTKIYHTRALNTYRTRSTIITQVQAHHRYRRSNPCPPFRIHSPLHYNPSHHQGSNPLTSPTPIHLFRLLTAHHGHTRTRTQLPPSPPPPTQTRPRPKTQTRTTHSAPRR